MNISFLRVLSRSKKSISTKTHAYILGLLLTKGRKNCASIAREHDVSYDLIRKSLISDLDYIEHCKQNQIRIIKDLEAQGRHGWVIIDFTLAIKRFMFSDDMVTYDYDGNTKKCQKGFSMGIAVWSDGKNTIPIDIEYWMRKKDAGDKYKKKADIVKEIIRRLKQIIPFSKVLLDGGFVSFDLFDFFKTKGLKYCMRIPKNRVVTSQGATIKLKEHPALKLYRNEKYKSVQASYRGIDMYVIAHKRKGKNETKEVVFIATNENISAKKCVKTYSNRWCIEKLNRTTKQSLGLADCQSSDPIKQRVHVWMVMQAYTMLEIIKYSKKKKSPEDILRILRWQKSSPEFNQYVDLMKTFIF